MTKITRVFLFIYCLGNCIAYTLITMEMGASFLEKWPHLVPLTTLVLVPFIASKNVAILKVNLKVQQNVSTLYWSNNFFSTQPTYQSVLWLSLL